MPTPRPGPRHDWHATWLGLAKALAPLIAVGPGLGLLFLLYFSLPKIESLYRDLGRPSPTPLTWAAISSFYLFKYFWVILIGCGPILVFRAWGNPPRPAAHARD